MEETDQYKSHVSASKGEATPPASLDDVNHAPGKEAGRQGGASRKTWFVLIALVLAAVIIISVTAGVILSKDDDDDNEVSTPTASPRGPAEMKLLADVVLPGVDLSGLDQTAPQYRALEWLAYEDFRYLTVEDDATELLERFSVATLYYATGGMNCPGLDNSKWLSSLSHCKWGDDIQLIHCKNGDVVTGILLLNRGLSGTLPPEIGNFRNAENILLVDTKIGGSVPTEAGQLTSLTSLGLISNEIEGSIPTEVGLLTSLTGLNLMRNSIVGTLPTEIGLLKSLTSLSLSSNGIGGTLPTEIGSLNQLKGIEVSDNQFVGTLPSEIGNLQQLISLFVSGNIGLTGTVPVEVGQLELITEAMFQNTSLTGGLDHIAFCKDPTAEYFRFRADCELACECCTCCGDEVCEVPDFVD